MIENHNHGRIFLSSFPSREIDSEKQKHTHLNPITQREENTFYIKSSF